MHYIEEIMGWYIEAMRKYAVFSGRDRRKAYWYFILVSFIVGWVVFLADYLISSSNIHHGMRPLSLIYGLAMVIPSAAAKVRRLHDTGRSGWWYWIALIPLIGYMVLCVFWAQDSQPGKNRYGSNPKAGRRGLNQSRVVRDS